jgi:hypothetical protein
MVPNVTAMTEYQADASSPEHTQQKAATVSRIETIAAFNFLKSRGRRQKDCGMRITE